MGNAPELDRTLDACGHKHRRIVLATLADQRQPQSIDDLTDAVRKHNHHLPRTEMDDEAVDRIRAGLHHVHLPKLAEAGVIHYDPDRNVAELPAQSRQGDAHLSAVLAMDSDLPTTD